jgi:hypothetical protein
MAIDPVMSDSMLGTFRNMYKECVDKEYSGPAFERMKIAMDRMENLAVEQTDFAAFSGLLMQENLMGNFSVAYGEVLAEAAKPKEGAAGTYDDAALLKTCLDALRDSIKRLDEGIEQAREEVKKHAKSGGEEKMKVDIAMVDNMGQRNESIKKAIQELIDFGKTCENLPTFLRVQIEKGMDKAMEGSAVTRGVYEEDVELNRMWYFSPYHIAKSEDTFESYKQLEAKAAFGVPEGIDIEMERTKIEHKYQPDIEKWNKVIYDWETIIDDLSTWATSNCPRAPVVDPWKMIMDPAERARSIKQDKHIYPGIIKERIRIFKENFGLDFMGIFKHNSFKWQCTDQRIWYSQEYLVHLINVVYPQCKPGNFLSQESIDQDEIIYKTNKTRNPDIMPSVEKYIKWFENKYGEGAWEKWGQSKQEPKGSNAASWNYEEFLKQINL